jgi:hypothetical protein
MAKTSRKELRASAAKKRAEAKARHRKKGQVADISADKARKNTSKSEPGTSFGTARGIESMFRNSYRAQLDMIALAATKANIMISVNGSLLALLTLASAYILTNEPRLLIPLIIFLLSGIVSIFFSVLAARPQKIEKIGTGLDDFRSTRADLLVFEYFAELSKEDHMTAMTELMCDKEGVYKAMIAHLYFLGKSANRSFKLLRISYSSFFVGLIVSLMAFATVVISTMPNSIAQ